MHPSDFFGHTRGVRGGHCFLVTPFAEKFDEVSATIKSALKDAGLEVEPHRADEDVHGGEVMEDVFRNIAEAELIIVDLTDRNPNVAYELGIAHSVRCAESVLLISQTTKNLPFDVGHYRCIEYQPGNPGLKKLGDELAQFISGAILPFRFVFSLEKDQVWRSPRKIFGKDGQSLYNFDVCVVDLPVGGAKFRLDVYEDEGTPDSGVHVLELERTIAIPRTLYALKLHGANSKVADFCVCRPD